MMGSIVRQTSDWCAPTAIEGMNDAKRAGFNNVFREIEARHQDFATCTSLRSITIANRRSTSRRSVERGAIDAASAADLPPCLGHLFSCAAGCGLEFIQGGCGPRAAHGYIDQCGISEMLRAVVFIPRL
jgi:hypothetical protein